MTCARGAKQTTHHGPFQRWLEDAPTSLLCARGIFSANRRVLAFARRIRISPYRRILAASSNGEAERPRTGASSETSAHTFFRALGELADQLSRPAPAIVRRTWRTTVH